MSILAARGKPKHQQQQQKQHHPLAPGRVGRTQHTRSFFPALGGGKCASRLLLPLPHPHRIKREPPEWARKHTTHTPRRKRTMPSRGRTRSSPFGDMPVGDGITQKRSHGDDDNARWRSLLAMGFEYIWVRGARRGQSAEEPFRRHDDDDGAATKKKPLPDDDRQWRFTGA